MKFAIKFAQALRGAFNQKRCTPPSYNVNNEVFQTWKLSRTTASSAQTSRKLVFKRYSPFKIVEPICQNAVRQNVPPNIWIHPIHVKHTAQVNLQPQDISNESPSQIQPFIDGRGELVIEVY